MWTWWALVVSKQKEKVKIMWTIVCGDRKKDSLVIEITRIILEKKKKKRVNKYNNYSCEHGEHLLYQNKKKN